MADASNVCGLCGAPNPSEAVVCELCGALLAAYRSAQEPLAIAETPVEAEAPAEAPAESPLAATSASEAPGALVAAPSVPGSAAASIFGETKLSPLSSSTIRGGAAPAMPPAQPAPVAPRPVPEETKSQRLHRLARERIQALEDEAKPTPSTFQPTFQQLRRKSAPARQSLLDLVARQPKQIGIVSFVLFIVSMSMLGSGILGAEIIGLFVLIAALIGGGAALLAASRDFLDRHDWR